VRQAVLSFRRLPPAAALLAGPFPLVLTGLKFQAVPADYEAKLARTAARTHAPRGSWNETSCRDGGRWDLVPGRRSLD
jgi:hypothetical protein